MFPADSTDLEAVVPLSWDAVVTELLFPETVVLLLQDELRIDISSVLQVLRERNIGCGSRKVWLVHILSCSESKIIHTPTHSPLKRR